MRDANPRRQTDKSLTGVLGILKRQSDRTHLF